MQRRCFPVLIAILACAPTEVTPAHAPVESRPESELETSARQLVTWACVRPRYRDCGSLEDANACVRRVEREWSLCRWEQRLGRWWTGDQRAVADLDGFVCGVRRVLETAKVDAPACREIASYLSVLEAPRLMGCHPSEGLHRCIQGDAKRMGAATSPD